jgi:dihydroorotase-like cyclic amidohydrolase
MHGVKPARTLTVVGWRELVSLPELGLAGIPACAEEVVVRRDLVLAELAGIHLHLGPISTAGAVDAMTTEIAK